MVKLYSDFPVEWLANPTILYHGTSNYFEKDIDTKGLSLTDISVKKNAAKKIREIYDNDLVGIIDFNAPGGLDILRYFEREIDVHNCRPISLAYHPSRCHLYASEEFAGGEFVRTVIKSIIYLQNLCTDGDALREWESAMLLEWEEEYSMLRRKHPVMPMINTVQLVEKLKSLQAIFDDFLKIRNSYKYGLIYAVDLSETPVSSLAWETNKRGLYSLSSIPAENIMGKVYLKGSSLKSKQTNTGYFDKNVNDYWREKFNISKA